MFLQLFIGIYFSLLSPKFAKKIPLKRTNTKDRAGKETIQTETEYHGRILGFTEEAKGVHNMWYSLLLVNDVEGKLRNLQDQVLVLDR